MAIKPRYFTSEEAKKAGWFSRRHRTSEEHVKATKARMEKMVKSLLKEI